MQTAFFIAKRYFFSQKKKNVIQIISLIAMGSVAVVTAALVIVMAGFNGMEALTMEQYNVFYPEIEIIATRGKTFIYNDSLKSVLGKVKNIAAITEVIEDNALIRYGNVQAVVNLKGVSKNFVEQYDIKSRLIAGDFYIEKDNRAYMILGLGVFNQLSVDMGDVLKPLMCWYPKRQKNLSLEPDKAFKKLPIMASGAVSVEQQFDQNHVLVPLEFAADLMQYETKRTSLEIKTSNSNVEMVQEALKNCLGTAFVVRNREEQQISILRAIKIERLLVFFAFAFILAISSFNIFFSLAMLAIEKRKDIAILFSLGASRQTVKWIFLYIGAIIAGTGAVSGLLLGYGICVAQQQFGFVKLGISSAVVDSYPVKLFWTDFAAICLTVVLITVLSSYIPARNAVKVEVSAEL
jgi:lipoprotein-releasing system permease protein